MGSLVEKSTIVIVGGRGKESKETRRGDGRKGIRGRKLRGGAVRITGLTHGTIIMTMRAKLLTTTIARAKIAKVALSTTTTVKMTAKTLMTTIIASAAHEVDGFVLYPISRITRVLWFQVRSLLMSDFWL